MAVPDVFFEGKESITALLPEEHPPPPIHYLRIPGARLERPTDAAVFPDSPEVDRQ